MSKIIELKDWPGYGVDRGGQCYSRWVGNGHSPAKLFSKWKKIGYERPDGRLEVLLYKNGKTLHAKAHNLVAKVFIPNPNNKPCACHIDGNPKNNRVENLYWGSQKENYSDSVKHGTYTHGEKHGNSKLNEKQVRVIKYCLRDGMTIKAIAKYFPVYWSVIGSIKCGRTWKHVII